MGVTTFQRNISQLEEQLEATLDAAERERLLKLLIREENNFAQNEDFCQTLERHVAAREERIKKQRALVRARNKKCSVPARYTPNDASPVAPSPRDRATNVETFGLYRSVLNTSPVPDCRASYYPCAGLICPLSDGTLGLKPLQNLRGTGGVPLATTRRQDAPSLKASAIPRMLTMPGPSYRR
jgi:hypothetical protein